MFDLQSGCINRNYYYIISITKLLVLHVFELNNKLYCFAFYISFCNTNMYECARTCIVLYKFNCIILLEIIH